MDNMSQKNSPVHEDSPVRQDDTHTEQAPKAGPVTAPEAGPKAEQVTLTDSMLQQFVHALKPRPFYKRHPIFFACILIFFTFLVGSCFFSDDITMTDEDRIAVVRVEGVILDTRPTLEWIEQLKQDNTVKGILLRIDSPGGGAAASQELHHALVNLAKRKPIVASMGSAAASGGLMVAMAAEYIVANPSTITGSIGVRMDIMHMYELMDTLGIDRETLKTGKFKDAGDSMRPMTDEERAYLEGIMQDMHEQFVLLVAEGRKKTPEEIRLMADGRIFTGREARELGLVDALGGQDTALEELYKLTQVAPTAALLEQESPMDFWREMLEIVLDISLDATQGASKPSFYF